MLFSYRCYVSDARDTQFLHFESLIFFFFKTSILNINRNF